MYALIYTLNDALVQTSRHAANRDIELLLLSSCLGLMKEHLPSRNYARATRQS